MPNSSTELSRWLNRVDALAPKIRAAKVQAEEDCRLPASLLEDLSAAGLFRMWLPSELGGHDVDPATASRVIEAVARIDGSTGWCIGPGNVSSLFAAFLPEAAARDVYGGEWAVNAAGSIAGMGVAAPVEGGFRLSGRWAFCTNSYGCPWYLGIFTVMKGDEPRRLKDGAPDIRFFYFPADKAEVLPTWDTGGLRGTASNDIVLADVTVGENYGFAINAKPWTASPMYGGGIKLWGKAAFVAVALGIAQASIDALTGLAKTRVRTGAASPMSEQSVLRDELGRADAMLLAARQFFYQSIEDCSATLNAGLELDRRRAARLGQSCSHLADTSRNVTQTMYRLGGGASVYRSCLLDRCLRDVHVAAQHASIGPKNYDEAARISLEMESA